MRTNSLGVNLAVRVNRLRDGQVQEEAISDSDDEDASSRLQIVPYTVQQEVIKLKLEYQNYICVNISSFLIINNIPCFETLHLS